MVIFTYTFITTDDLTLKSICAIFTIFIGYYTVSRLYEIYKYRKT